MWAVSGVPQRFQADLRVDADLTDPDLDVKILMYRGLQEALSNMVRHSGATRISVDLGLRDGVLVLTVDDNGVGFDVRAAVFGPRQCGLGIGLRALRETAQELGGKLEVESGPNGTKLVVSVTPFRWSRKLRPHSRSASKGEACRNRQQRRWYWRTTMPL